MSTLNISKRVLLVAISAIGILLIIPLIVVYLNSQLSWTGTDFVLGGLLFLGTILLFGLMFLQTKATWFRTALAIVLVACLLLVWAELAVGIFGTPFAGS